MKNKLTEAQKKFLLSVFFVNVEFPGWRNVAEMLLEEGSCIVAGEACIWQGGIGNFIETRGAKHLWGCLEYTFDLGKFLHSAYYDDVKSLYLQDLKSNLQELEAEVAEQHDVIMEIRGL